MFLKTLSLHMMQPRKYKAAFYLPNLVEILSLPTIIVDNAVLRVIALG